jgi:hypothetical protein
MPILLKFKEGVLFVNTLRLQKTESEQILAPSTGVLAQCSMRLNGNASHGWRKPAALAHFRIAAQAL